MCWVSGATADSTWQDRLSECTLSRRKFPLGGAQQMSYDIDKHAARCDRKVTGI